MAIVEGFSSERADNAGSSSVSWRYQETRYSEDDNDDDDDNDDIDDDDGVVVDDNDDEDDHDDDTHIKCILRISYRPILPLYF